MIIYKKNRDNNIICVPIPCGYKHPSYKVAIRGNGYDRVYEGLTDNSTLSDFVVLYIDDLESYHLGEYYIDVNDGYALAILRVVGAESVNEYNAESEKFVYDGQE